jgi:hypothetical protein
MTKQNNYNLKLIAVISIMAIIFSFSFSLAQEQTAPADSGSSTGAETPTDATTQTETAVTPDSVSAQADLGIPPSQSETIEPAGQESAVEKPEVTEGSHEIATGIIRNLDINKLTIIADWRMSAQKENGQYLGTDDSADNGGQFLPSGQFEVDHQVAICALVGGPGGADSVNSIKAVINYPKNIAINEGGQNDTVGCGRIKSQLSLNKLSASEADRLVCDTLRNKNNNLLTWYSSTDNNITFSYDQACGQEGYLAKQMAAVYCEDVPFAYNDPAGDYRIKTVAENNTGQSDEADNNIKYLEMTTFETDFTSIQYGPVKQGEPKILQGDLDFADHTGPTVRNTGNTRLQIKIRQNDFGLGKSNGEWNIVYQARVGSAQFKDYQPEQTTELSNSLNIGEKANIDFGTLIKAFPDESNKPSFWGDMTVSADKALPATCQ